MYPPCSRLMSLWYYHLSFLNINKLNLIVSLNIKQLKCKFLLLLNQVLSLPSYFTAMDYHPKKKKPKSQTIKCIIWFVKYYSRCKSNCKILPESMANTTFNPLNADTKSCVYKPTNIAFQRCYVWALLHWTITRSTWWHFKNLSKNTARKRLNKRTP